MCPHVYPILCQLHSNFKENTILSAKQQSCSSTFFVSCFGKFKKIVIPNRYHALLRQRINSVQEFLWVWNLFSQVSKSLLVLLLHFMPPSAQISFRGEYTLNTISKVEFSSPVPLQVFVIAFMTTDIFNIILYMCIVCVPPAPNGNSIMTGVSIYYITVTMMSRIVPFTLWTINSKLQSE